MQTVDDLFLRLVSLWHQIRADFPHERAQTLTEYGLLVSLIAIAVVVAAVAGMRDSVIGIFEQVAGCLTDSCDS